MSENAFAPGRCPSCGHAQHIGGVCGVEIGVERIPENGVAHLAWNALTLLALTPKEKKS